MPARDSFVMELEIGSEPVEEGGTRSESRCQDEERAKRRRKSDALRNGRSGV